MPAKKYYAVRKGRATGLFETWPECQAQVHGFPGAEFKSFNTAGEALQYVGLAGGAGPGKSNRSNPSNTSGTGRFQPYQTAAAPMASIGVMIATPSTLPTPVAPPKPDHDRVIGVCLARGEAVEEFPSVRISAVPRTYQVNFDGASRGNPGKAGAGACIVEVATGRKVADLACPLPFGCTNNEAEYGGLILGLQACLSLGIRDPYVKGDSNLVVNQVNGTWKVNKDHLRPYHAAACDLLGALAVGRALPQLQHVYREDNAEADRLSNVAVDMQ